MGNTQNSAFLKFNLNFVLWTILPTLKQPENYFGLESNIFLNQIIYGYHFFGSNSFWIKQFLDQYIFLRISDDFSLNQQLKHSVSTHKLTIIITFTSNRVLLFLIVFISFFFIMLN